MPSREPLFCRHPWLGPVLLVLVIVTWTCVDGYLAALP